ncbi:hypothetical protein A6R71_06030 [Xanthomonas translucens pv. arrhenatheri]|nr:hypothetical protein A6R71_06030 [Xanthomonas translucens pv. arrhenatheri]
MFSCVGIATAAGAPCCSVSASAALALVSTVTPGHLPRERLLMRLHCTFQLFTPEGCTRRCSCGTAVSQMR